jgi:hypothetical protein
MKLEPETAQIVMNPLGIAKTRLHLFSTSVPVVSTGKEPVSLYVVPVRKSLRRVQYAVPRANR